MTGHYENHWQQQPTPPHPPSGFPAGYPAQPPRKPRWPWIIGGIVVVLIAAAIAAVAIVMHVVTRPPDQATGTVRVVYEVTGSGKANIRYNDIHDSLVKLRSVDLPWRIEVSMQTTDMPFVSGEQAAGPQMNCRISSAGNVLNERHSSVGLVYCDSEPSQH